MESQILKEQLAFEKWQKVIPKGSMAAAMFGSSIFAESRGVVEIIWGYLKDLWQTDLTIFIYEDCWMMNYNRSGRNSKTKMTTAHEYEEKEQPPDEVIAMHSLGSTNFPSPTDIKINMMPFIYGKKDSLPQAYQGYWNMIEQCKCSKENGKVVFLTIDESMVLARSSQRRGGVHVESPGKLPFLKTPLKWKLWHPWGMGGWMLGELLGGIYMSSTVTSSTKVWPCIMQDPKSNAGWYGDCEHFRDILEKPVKLDANELFWITDRTPHESCVMHEGGYRQYFRLVTSEVAAWFEEHSTPNPLGVKPGIEIVKGNKFDLITGNPLMKIWRRLQKK